jgi:RNA polymerase sigma-70 factor (ECF subfamily)
MADRASLTEMALSGLDASRRALASGIDQLEPWLAEAWTTGRTAWPKLHLTPEVYLPFLGQRIPFEDGKHAWSSVHVADLYLACACISGDHEALAACERSCFGGIDDRLRRMDLPIHLLDEVKQRLRVKLFVARGDEAPKIGEYSGRGDLGGWVQAVAIREALSLVRRQKPVVAIDDDALADSPLVESPELEYVRRQYHAEFKSAFEEAMASLSVRERNLLRQHALDGLSIDEIGAVYGVHRATAARWLASARESLGAAVEQALAKHLRLSRGQLESVLQLVRSQLDLSLERVLGREGSEGEPLSGGNPSPR